MSPRSPGSTINPSMSPLFSNSWRKEHPEMIPAALLGRHVWEGTVEISRRSGVCPLVLPPKESGERKGTTVTNHPWLTCYTLFSFTIFLTQHFFFVDVSYFTSKETGSALNNLHEATQLMIVSSDSHGSQMSKPSSLAHLTLCCSQEGFLFCSPLKDNCSRTGYTKDRRSWGGGFKVSQAFWGLF